MRGQPTEAEYQCIAKYENSDKKWGEMNKKVGQCLVHWAARLVQDDIIAERNQTMLTKWNNTLIKINYMRARKGDADQSSYRHLIDI